MDMCRMATRYEGLLVGLLVIWDIVWGLEFVEPPPDTTLYTTAEGPTRLPCLFRVEGEKVVQVSWSKDNPDGSKEMVITAHYSEGQKEFVRFSGRVYFENSDPMVNSALMIRTTELTDEGKYSCHVATFPTGNFDIQLSLTVWTLPIASLDPMVLVEGQSFRVAATCRSVARPPARLTWDTDLPGQRQNRSSDGSVSSHFSLHPLRSMNGKKLDCLVWHPTLESPRRFSNNLVVHFPPDVTIGGFDGDWHVGREQASLQCNSGGNPAPQNFTWTRSGSPLPQGVSVRNGTLSFDRPISLTDAGQYQCTARNLVGVGKADVEITISEFAQQKTTFDSLMFVIIGVVVGLLVIAMIVSVVMVNNYHKRKNKKLEIELTEKKEEISTLSRQASFRRVNYVNTDHHMQGEETQPLRVEGTIRSSLSSLGEQGRCRDSRSTLSGGRGAVDSLGRPALYNSSRRGERAKDKDLDREGDKDDNLSTVESCDSRLRAAFHPPLKPSVSSYERTADFKPVNGRAILPGGDRAQHSPLSSGYPVLTDEEEEEDEHPGDVEREHWAQTELHREDYDQSSKTSSLRISEALTNNFHYSNGTLRPKPLGNAILIHPKGQIV